MDAFSPFLISAGGFAAVLGLFAWLAVRIRRRGLAGGAMSAALASDEEAFRATAHASHIEIRAQADRRAPLLSPDDHWGRSPGEAAHGAGPEKPPQRQPRPRRARRGLRRWAGRLKPGR